MWVYAGAVVMMIRSVWTGDYVMEPGEEDGGGLRTEDGSQVKARQPPTDNNDNNDDNNNDRPLRC
jgi:hypothetical protein